MTVTGPILPETLAAPDSTEPRPTEPGALIVRPAVEIENVTAVFAVEAAEAGQAVAVGDINGDGLPDVVVADSLSFVSVSLGRKDRGYPVPLTLTPAASGSIALGDINGDGLPEILISGIPSPPYPTLLVFPERYS